MGGGPGRTGHCATGRGQKGQAGILPVGVMAPKSRANAAAGTVRGKAGRRSPVRSKSADVPLLPIVVGGILGVLVIAMIVAIVYFGRPAAAPQSVGAIKCDQLEHTQVHYHAAVQIMYQGNVVNIPDNVGIQTNSAGTAVNCYYWLHVHAANKNVIHIESPASDTFTLGQFFDVWDTWSKASGGQPQKLDAKHVSTFTLGPEDKIVVYIDLGDGKGAQPYTGDPRAIVLKSHEVITIEIAPPDVNPPPTFTFPSGL